MKNLALALFVMWYLSLHFYLYVPGVISLLLGAAFVSVATVALLEWVTQRRSITAQPVDRHGSLGL